MATVIDSLLVELSLDPSKFTAGQKAAGESMTKLRGQSEQEAKKIEAAGKTAAQYFGEIKKAAGELLALFTAGLGAAGAAEFLRQITGVDVQLGRLAGRSGQSAQTLWVWGQASAALGGSAQATENTMATLANTFARVGIFGDTSLIPFLAKIPGGVKELHDGALDVQEVLLGLADTVKGMPKAQATAFLAGMGLDPGTISLIEQGRAAIEKLLGTYGKLAPNRADIAASEQLQRAWVQLEDTWTQVGRALATSLTPALNAVAKDLMQLGDWAKANPHALDAIAGALAALSATAIIAGLGALAVSLGPVAALLAGIAVSMGAIAGYLSGDSSFWRWLQKLGPSNPNALPGPRPQMGTGGTFMPGAYIEGAPGGTGLPALVPAAFSSGIAGAPGGVPGAPYTGGGITGALLSRIAYVESGDNPNAVSPAGAEGLFQFMPSTAAQYGVNPWDPASAYRGAYLYLSDLLREFGGNLAKAIAAYNWGPGNVARDVAQWGTAWREHLPPETSAYLRSVLGGWPGGAAPPGIGAGASVTHNNTNNSRSASVGSVTIQTQATDAKGIANDLRRVMERSLAASSANFGQA